MSNLFKAIARAVIVMMVLVMALVAIPRVAMASDVFSANIVTVPGGVTVTVAPPHEWHDIKFSITNNGASTFTYYVDMIGSYDTVFYTNGFWPPPLGCFGDNDDLWYMRCTVSVPAGQTKTYSGGLAAGRCGPVSNTVAVKFYRSGVLQTTINKSYNNTGYAGVDLTCEDANNLATVADSFTGGEYRFTFGNSYNLVYDIHIPYCDTGNCNGTSIDKLVWEGLDILQVKVVGSVVQAKLWKRADHVGGYIQCTKPDDTSASCSMANWDWLSYDYPRLELTVVKIVGLYGPHECDASLKMYSDGWVDMQLDHQIGAT